MLCLSGVELYSRWVPLILYQGLAQSLEEMLGIVLVQGWKLVLVRLLCWSSKNKRIHSNRVFKLEKKLSPVTYS